MKLVSKTLELAGRTLTLEVGRFAARLHRPFLPVTATLHFWPQWSSVRRP